MTEVGPKPTGWRQVVVRMLAGSVEDLAGTVYGTVVVLAVIAAGSSPEDVDAWGLVILVVSTTLVLWVGHVYANGLGESVRLGHRLSLGEFRRLARREAAIPLAAFAPCVVLCVGALGIISEGSAVWLALGVGVGTLGFEGLRYARLEQMGQARALLTIGANVALGVTIVAVKIAVTH
jgi:hypothetical protein